MANERVQRRIERLLDEADEAVSRYDGVPLFVEELTRMVVESGLLHEVDGSYELSGPLPPLAIPSTLQNSLTTRLDRLSSARESVQLAAVLGREFSYELIQAVSPLDDAALARDLGQLVASEFLYQRGLPPESTYIFKHVEAGEPPYQGTGASGNLTRSFRAGGSRVGLTDYAGAKLDPDKRLYRPRSSTSVQPSQGINRPARRDLSVLPGDVWAIRLLLRSSRISIRSRGGRAVSGGGPTRPRRSSHAYGPPPHRHHYGVNGRARSGA